MELKLKKNIIERTYDVFDFSDDEKILDVNYVDNELRIQIQDINDYDIWFYIPEMEQRPQALAYVLGEREDFND